MKAVTIQIKFSMFLLTTIVVALLVGALSSCDKTDSDPMVICHVKEYKDGTYWQDYTESKITCKECEEKNRSYTEPDTEFPNITYHITDQSWCEPQ
jgi:hypothetical protein